MTKYSAQNGRKHSPNVICP